MCGADSDVLADALGVNGSSPRVRSRLIRHGDCVILVGIISACAEQARNCLAICIPRRDHLRVCGADVHKLLADTIESGSSPRVRSRLPVRRAGGHDGGIISACAEQTIARTPPCFL